MVIYNIVGLLVQIRVYSIYQTLYAELLLVQIVQKCSEHRFWMI
ncbi:putative glycosyltransferase [Francisella tularensis]|nr:putative glycosyltransferase [Francisella tularensis]